MLKIKYIIAIILFASVTSFGQDTIYSIAYTTQHTYSYFEDRDVDNYFYFDSLQTNNVWEIGTPSKTLFNGAYTSPLALITDSINYYPNNNTSSFEFVIKSDDLTIIEFWHKFDTDSLKDGGMIEVSMNGGSSWTNIIQDSVNNFGFYNFYQPEDTIHSLNSQPGFTGSSNGWKRSSFSKNGGMNFYRFRFTFSSDSINNNKEGWMLDNFYFQCLGTSLSKIKSNNSIKVYPNPSESLVFIEMETGLNLEYINVYSSSGKLISQEFKNTLDVSNWIDGFYFLEIITDKGTYTKKIVKEYGR